MLISRQAQIAEQSGSPVCCGLLASFDALFSVPLTVSKSCCPLMYACRHTHIHVRVCSLYKCGNINVHTIYESSNPN